MTGGGCVKSRWFWVKSSTRSVADMMSSFSGRCLWGTRDPGTHGHPGPGTLMAGLGQTSALPSWSHLQPHNLLLSPSSGYQRSKKK